jgi:hypothetical protein
MMPTLNDPNFRTSGRNVPAGSAQDTTKYMPWRAPGNAPTSDACGLAGGTWFAQTLGGDFNATQYAKLGDKGSVVLPPRDTCVVWLRGQVAHPTWYIRANHGEITPHTGRLPCHGSSLCCLRLCDVTRCAMAGGGYSYRLCPYKAGVNVTEECFQQMPLDFLPESRLVWMNGSSLDFKATLVNVGTTPPGSMW